MKIRIKPRAKVRTRAKITSSMLGGHLDMEGEGDFVTIARVAKTQGRHGEVAANLFTDFPEKFEERRKLLALDSTGERRDLMLEHHWPHKGWMVLKFTGVDSIEQAEELIGCELQIPATQRAVLEEDANYVSDLIGCTVFDWASGVAAEVGAVQDVQFGSGVAPTLIVASQVSPGSRKIEQMIPLAQDFLRKIDVSAKRIDMELPEGLLDLERPLNQEEKEHQHRKD